MARGLEPLGINIHTWNPAEAAEVGAWDDPTTCGPVSVKTWQRRW
jgi:hypothetical protein